MEIVTIKVSKDTKASEIHKMVDLALVARKATHIEIIIGGDVKPFSQVLLEQRAELKPESVAVNRKEVDFSNFNPHVGENGRVYSRD